MIILILLWLKSLELLACPKYAAQTVLVYEYIQNIQYTQCIGWLQDAEGESISCTPYIFICFQKYSVLCSWMVARHETISCIIFFFSKIQCFGGLLGICTKNLLFSKHFEFLKYTVI